MKENENVQEWTDMEELNSELERLRISMSLREKIHESEMSQLNASLTQLRETLDCAIYLLKKATE